MAGSATLTDHGQGYLGPPTWVPAWNGGNGLPACLRDLYVKESGREPTSAAEFCQWANKTGRRATDGTWNCASAPLSASAAGGFDVMGHALSEAEGWLGEHQLAVIGVVILGVLVFWPRRS